MYNAVDLNDKDFSSLMEKSKKMEVNQIELDILVLLKIVKHCSEKELVTVSGHLLGANFENNLEITNCYPLPNQEEEKREESDSISYDDEQKYQTRIQQCLQELNVDNNIVGWYQSSWFESHVDVGLVDAQYTFQTEVGKRSVCIIFDPFQSKNGKLKVKAIRLTDSFMELLKEAYKVSTSSIQVTQELISKSNLTHLDIFEQVPIKIRFSPLFRLLTSSVCKVDEDCDFECLNLDTNGFLEMALENIVEFTDYLNQDQNKHLYYQRKVSQQKHIAKKKEEDVNLKNINAPGRIEGLLMTNQVSTCCDDVSSLTNSTINKMKLIKDLIK